MWRIEPLDESSWARLRAIRLRALLDEPDAFGSSFEREDVYDEAAWRALLRPGGWWLAVAGDEDVGIVAGSVHRDNGTPWMFSMWVAPAWRGRGVAEALVREVTVWAAALGSPRLGLDVTDRVPRARRFYDRLGFVESDTTLPLPRDPSITLIEMYLDLAGAD